MPTSYAERIIDMLIGGGALEVVRFLFGKKKNQAETDKIVSDNWREYAQNLELRFAELQKEHSDIRAKYFELELKYQRLILKIDNDTTNSRPPRTRNRGAK